MRNYAPKRTPTTHRFGGTSQADWYLLVQLILVRLVQHSHLTTAWKYWLSCELCDHSLRPRQTPKHGRLMDAGAGMEGKKDGSLLSLGTPQEL